MTIIHDRLVRDSIRPSEDRRSGYVAKINVDAHKGRITIPIYK